jgi:hypothetical protein
MPTIVTIVTCEVDGHAIAGSPFVSTLEVQQYDLVIVQKPQDAADEYRVIPGTNGAFPIITGLLLFNIDEPLSYRLQGQLTSSLPLGADGFLLALGTNISVGNANLRVNSLDGICSILGFVAGKGLPLTPPTNLVIDERWEADYPTPTTQVIDERWEGGYVTPTTLVIDERWEGGDFPTPPTTLLIDERWELGDRACTTDTPLLRELFENLYCDVPNEFLRELFEA